MFKIMKNEAYKLYSVRSGKKQDGSPYVLLKMRECDIQPAGLEKPSASKSPINIWFRELPANLKDIKDGSVIRFKDFDGFSFYREKFESYGKEQYMAAHEIFSPTIELV